LASGTLSNQFSTKIAMMILMQQETVFMAVTTSRAILDKIKEKAIAKWGEKRWVAELVKKYVEIAIENGDESATAVNRRPQVERAFNVGSCSADTLILIVAAVGGRFQLAFTVVEEL
jgi:hypothetical protein